MLKHMHVEIGPWLLAVTMVITAARPTFAEDNPLRAYFPYGVYVGGGRPKAAIERVCQDLAAHNMNAAWLSNCPDENIPLWLEAARAHGVRVVPQGGGPPRFLRPHWFENRQQMVEQVCSAYKPLVDEHKDDPALLAWSLTEENPYLPWFHEGMGQILRQMAAWDPGHPAIVVDNRAPAAWMTAQVVKPRVLAMDSYPFWADGLNGPVSAIGTRSLWTRQCRRMRHAAESIDVPFWMMGQGMALTHAAGGGRSHEAWRYPTPAEIRWQFWTAIQEGAKGFFYFIYGSSARPKGENIHGLRGLDGAETPQFRMAAELGRWLKLLSPLLLELDVAPVHKQVAYWENTPVSVQTHVHRGTGQRFVIAVNSDRDAIQRIGIELGYWPGMLEKDEKLLDLRSGRICDYNTIKLATLLPGDGTVFLVGTAEACEAFSDSFYAKE